MKQYVENMIEGVIAVAGEAVRGVQKKIPVDKKRVVVWTVIGVGTFAFAWMRDTLTKKAREYGNQ